MRLGPKGNRGSARSCFEVCSYFGVTHASFGTSRPLRRRAGQRQARLTGSAQHGPLAEGISKALLTLGRRSDSDMAHTGESFAVNVSQLVMGSRHVQKPGGSGRKVEVHATINKECRFGVLAQLARASLFQSEGRQFKPGIPLKGLRSHKIGVGNLWVVVPTLPGAKPL